MEHFTFGRNNGLRVSALALGAGSFGSRWGYGADPDDVPTIFDTVRRRGRHVHRHRRQLSARRGRGNLGRLLHGRRDSFTVATKFAIGGPEGTGVLQTGNGRRAHVPLRRRQSAPARHRLHRPAVGALPRSGHPDRGDRARPRRPGARRQDPLRRVVEFPGVDVRARGDPGRIARAHPGFGGSAGVQPRRTQR